MTDQRHVIDPDDEILPDITKIDAGKWKNPLKGWYNRPDKKLIVKDTKMIMRIPQRTECWRKTRHNFCRDNAPFHWCKLNSDQFTVIVNITGSFENTYDKAGLMIRVDESNWCTCGLEWFENIPHAASSITLDYTDWALIPLPKNAEKAGIWFCMKRNKDCMEMFYSFTGTDHDSWIPMRQSTFSPVSAVYVGIFGSNPLGKNDFKATYDFFNIIES